MTTLPTYAECAAVPPEKRTALERFIWANQPPNDEYPGMETFRDQLTAVIEEERAQVYGLRIELAHLSRVVAGQQLRAEMAEADRADMRKERDALTARLAEARALLTEWAAHRMGRR